METILLHSVNHKKKQVVTYEVTKEIIQEIKEMFSSSEEAVYSLGFQRYLKLSRAKYKRLSEKMLRDGVKLNELLEVVKAKLEAMSEVEFSKFKKEL